MTDIDRILALATDTPTHACHLRDAPEAPKTRCSENGRRWRDDAGGWRVVEAQAIYDGGPRAIDRYIAMETVTAVTIRHGRDECAYTESMALYMAAGGGALYRSWRDIVRTETQRLPE